MIFLIFSCVHNTDLILVSILTKSRLGISNKPTLVTRSWRLTWKSRSNWRFYDLNYIWLYTRYILDLHLACLDGAQFSACGLKIERPPVQVPPHTNFFISAVPQTQNPGAFWSFWISLPLSIRLTQVRSCVDWSSLSESVVMRREVPDREGGWSTVGSICRWVRGTAGFRS